MNIKNKFSYLIKIFSCCFIIFVTQSALAKAINLYEQPQADAKIISQIDISAGVIPIFTPKDNTAWIKVGDPRNGNVGWVKSSELGQPGSSVTFTQRIVNQGQGPHTYQIIEYGQPPQKLTPEQVQEMVQKMQTRQRVLQQSLQNAVQQMLEEINNLSQDQLHYNAKDFPIIMPIIVVPQQQKPATIAPQPQTPTPKKTTLAPATSSLTPRSTIP